MNIGINRIEIEQEKWLFKEPVLVGQSVYCFIGI